MAAPAACRQMSKAGSSARPSPSAMQTRGYSTRAEAGGSVRSMSSWREQGAWGSARGGPQWQRCKRSMQTHVQQLKPYLQAAGRNDTTIINLCKRECGRCSRYLQAAGCNGTSNLCKRVGAAVIPASSRPQGQPNEQLTQTRICGDSRASPASARHESARAHQ